MRKGTDTGLGGQRLPQSLVLQMLRADLGEGSLLELAELGELLLLLGEPVLQSDHLIFQAFDLGGSWVGRGAGFAQCGQAALELLGQVLVRARTR
ncbi:hypothetical protein [Streptomyces sp. NPDC056296]|uniref:hypothetical protein n=1 Tax=Streptomyces sp. NPDC056296 TaxID=3345775 RepID=UPI0035E1F024